MAEPNDLIKNLEKELTCSVCDEIYNEPKTLQCLHSFCSKCIENWIETCRNRRQRLSCPTCRSQEDVSKLRSSFYLHSMKQLLLAMRNNTDKPEVAKDVIPNCVSCQEQQKLVAFCQQCQGMICTDCINAHKKMKQLRHQVIMFNDFKQEHVKSYINNQVRCEEKLHEDQRIQYFCQTCQECVCSKCNNESHSNHEKLGIEEKADEKKRVISSNIDRINQQKQRFVKELEQSKQNIRRIEFEIKTATRKVSNYVQAQIQVLKDHENEMKKALDGILVEQRILNEEEQNDIIAAMQQFDAVNEQCNRLQHQNVDYLILQSQLPQRCEELLQRQSVLLSKPVQRNTSVNYMPNSHFTQSLQDIGNIVQTVTEPSSCSLELENKEVRCGFVNTFEIVTRAANGEVCHTEESSIDILIKDVDGTEVEYKFAENKTGMYLVSYKAEKPSPYQLNASIGGQNIKNSPKKIRTIFAKADFRHLRNIGEQEDFKFPLSLAVNNIHQLAIVDNKDHSTVIFTKDGKMMSKIVKTGVPDNKLHNPLGVVMYEDKMLVSDQSDGIGRIQVFDNNGAYLRTIYKQEGVVVIAMCTTGENISALTWLKTDDKYQTAIKLFSKQSGQVVRDIPISTVGRDKKDLPYFITSNENKYFLSYLHQSYISVHDDNGLFLYKVGEEGKESGHFNGVAGLTTYGEDMLLTCDGDNHRVQVFTQDGQFITSFGCFGSGRGQMKGPWDVAVSSDGRVFVLERYGKRVQVWQ